jgi:hypothetical protein
MINTYISDAFSGEAKSSKRFSDFCSFFSFRTLNKAYPAGVSKRTSISGYFKPFYRLLSRISKCKYAKRKMCDQNCRNRDLSNGLRSVLIFGLQQNQFSELISSKFSNAHLNTSIALEIASYPI